MSAAGAIKRHRAASRPRRPLALRVTMRAPLTGITVRVDGTPIAASTTIAAVGANVLLLTSAIPGRATTLPSCYLARSDAALAVSQLASDAIDERLTQPQIAPSEHHSTLAGACMLEHDAALRELLADRTGGLVSVDVDPDTLERAADAWGPPPPPG